MKPKLIRDGGITCFRLWPLKFYLYHGGGWFRLFGVGLAFKDMRQHGLLFGERNGYVRRISIGNWSIKFLRYE
jgi:hypothetical protein